MEFPPLAGSWRYTKSGGASDCRLRCKTNSLKDGARGGPVSLNGVIVTIGARAASCNQPANSARHAGGTSAALIPSVTTACSDLQHWVSPFFSNGVFSGSDVPFWQHA